MILGFIGYNISMKQVLDPKQTLAITNYKDPNSETFGNLKGSLINAGYSAQYANTIGLSKSKWMSNAIANDVDTIKKAQDTLNKMLTVKLNLNDKLGVDIAKLQVDVSKFILKSLAGAKYVGEGDKPLPSITLNVVNYDDKPVVHSVEVIE